MQNAKQPQQQRCKQRKKKTARKHKKEQSRVVKEQQHKLQQHNSGTKYTQDSKSNNNDHNIEKTWGFMYHSAWSC